MDNPGFAARRETCSTACLPRRAAGAACWRLKKVCATHAVYCLHMMRTRGPSSSPFSRSSRPSHASSGKVEPCWAGVGCCCCLLLPCTASSDGPRSVAPACPAKGPARAFSPAGPSCQACARVLAQPDFLRVTGLLRPATFHAHAHRLLNSFCPSLSCSPRLPPFLQPKHHALRHPALPGGRVSQAGPALCLCHPRAAFFLPLPPFALEPCLQCSPASTPWPPLQAPGGPRHGQA